MNTIKLKFAGLAVAASFSLTAVTMLAMGAPAYAAPAVEKSRAVATHNLDLKTRAGQGALHERIQRAAERLCVDRFERMLATQKLGRDCVEEAVSATAPQVERAIQRDLVAAQSASLTLSIQP